MNEGTRIKLWGKKGEKLNEEREGGRRGKQDVEEGGSD